MISTGMRHAIPGIYERSHDATGVEYIRLISLSPAQFTRVSGGAQISIHRDRTGDEHYKPWRAELDGETIGLIGDDAAAKLRTAGYASFADPGQPDWDLRDCEKVEMDIARHEAYIEELRARLGVMRDRHAEKLASRAAGQAAAVPEM